MDIPKFCVNVQFLKKEKQGATSQPCIRSYVVFFFKRARVLLSDNGEFEVL